MTENQKIAIEKAFQTLARMDNVAFNKLVDETIGDPLADVVNNIIEILPIRLTYNKIDIFIPSPMEYIKNSSALKYFSARSKKLLTNSTGDTICLAA